MGSVGIRDTGDLLFKSLLGDFADLLLKGGGVFRSVQMPDGSHQVMQLSWPPAHGLRHDPTQPDHPPFAHDGQNPMFRDDGTAAGMHPIDGVISGVARMLQDAGVAAHPEEVVNKAIALFNSEHHGSHHLPPANDVEWRKVVSGPYQGNTPRGHMRTRGHDGKLITNNKNSGGDIGSFIESGFVPFYLQLQEILEQLGIPVEQQGRYGNFTTAPHIEPGLLADNVVRDKGRSGPVHGPGGRMRQGLLQGLGLEEALGDAAHGQLHTHDVAHHLPDLMFAPIKGRGRPVGTGKMSADMEGLRHGVMQGLQAGTLPYTEAMDAPVTVQTPGGPVTAPILQILGDPELTEHMVRDLSSTPAFRFLFSGHGGKGSGKVDQLMSPFFEQADPKAFGMHSTHTTHGMGRGEAKRGEHAYAAQVGALAAAYGQHPEDPTSSGLATATLGHPLEAHSEEIERRRPAVEAIAALMSSSRGHRPRWSPDWENMPEQPMSQLGIAGYGQSPFELPPHFAGRDYSDIMMAPGAQPQLTATEPSAVRGGGATTSTGPVASASGISHQSPPAAPSPRQLAPGVQALREQVREASFPELARIVEQTGAPIHSAERAARFQQTFGDPAQTLLEQFDPGFIPGGERLVRSDAEVEMLGRIEKAIERIQLLEAQQDDMVLKHLPTKRNLSLQAADDVRLMANQLGLTAQDVRAFASAKGDWGRIAKAFDVEPAVVSAVKVVFS